MHNKFYEIEKQKNTNIQQIEIHTNTPLTQNQKKHFNRWFGGVPVLLQ